MLVTAPYYRNSMSGTRTAVAVTGIGVVSPFGVGREVFWRAITAGTSGISAVEGVDPEHWPTRVVARVPDDAVAAAEEAVSQDDRAAEGRADRRAAKVSRIAVLAAREAMADAGLPVGADGVGVIVGSGAGGIDVAERHVR